MKYAQIISIICWILALITAYAWFGVRFMITMCLFAVGMYLDIWIRIHLDNENKNKK